MPGTIDVIIPIYNEESTVEALVARLRHSCPTANLVFVDNGSTDRTLEILSRMNDVHLIRHDRNLGYGRSISDGMVATTGDRVVILDADLEYHPEDIPIMLARLDSAGAVYGSRLLSPPGQPTALPWARSLGNRVVTMLFNVLFQQHLTDLYTGIRAVRRDVLPARGLHSPGFELVLELSVRLAQAGIRIAEVPAHYTPRTAGQSKMRHIRESVKFAYHLLRFRLSAAPRAP